MSLDNIKVVVRARPHLGNSAKSTSWVIENNNIFQKEDCTPTGIYSFDKICDVDEKNVDLYNTAVSPMVRSALDGINLTVFAYGATCSGKTYTMNGTSKDPGVIPRIINEIFEQIQTYNDRNFLLRVSYVEIYSEVINDLLDKNNKDLKIREDVFNCVNYNPTEKVIKSSKECLGIMKMGTANRTTGETQMNTFSSRSHSIFRIVIESTSNEDPDKPATVSHVNLIDLAGSERVSQTGATGQRFKEGAHINKSLTALGLVIRQLVDKKDFINYRDSKLTRILSNSLGGNAKTIIICNINLESVEDTQSTLMFAQGAKSIKNKPKINEISNDASLAKKLANEFSQVKKLLDAELEKTRRLESEKETSSGKIDRLLLQIKSLEENFVQKVKKPPKRRHTFCTKLSAISEDKEVELTHRDFNHTDEKSIRPTEDTLPSFSDIDLEYESLDISEKNSCEHTPVKNLKVQLSAIMGSYESLLEFTRLEEETDVTTKGELEGKIEELLKECADLKAYKQYAGAKIAKLVEEKEEAYKLCKNDQEFTEESLKMKFHKREQELLDRIAEMSECSAKNSLKDSISSMDEGFIKETADDNSASKNGIEEVIKNNKDFTLLELQQRVNELESELNDVKNDLFETQDKLVDLTEDLDKEEKKTKQLEEELKREVDLRIEMELKFIENSVIKNKEILQSLLVLEQILGYNETKRADVSEVKDNIILDRLAVKTKNILEYDVGPDSGFENTAVVNKHSNTSLVSCPEEIEIKLNDTSLNQSLETNNIDFYLNTEEMTNRKNSNNNFKQEKDIENNDNENIISEDLKNIHDLEINLLKNQYDEIIEKLKCENEALLQLYTSTQNEKENIIIENKTMVERLLTLQNELQRKTIELNNQTAKLEQAEKTIQAVRDEKDEQGTNYIKALEIQQLRDLHEGRLWDIHKEKGTITDHLFEANRENKRLEDLNSDLRTTYESDNLKREEETRQKISQAKVTIELEYKTMMETEENKTKEIVKKLTDLVTELRAEISEHQKEKMITLESLNEAKCAKESLNQQISSLQEKYESEKLQREQEIKERFAQEKESLELEYKTMMQTEKNRAEEIINKLNDRVIELVQEITKLEKENKLFNDSMTDVNCDIQFIKDQNIMLQQKFERLKEEAVASTKKYEQQLISLKTERDENIERLSNEIKNLEKENTALLQENAQCITMENEKKNLQQENEFISGRLRVANKEIERQNIQLNKLDASLHAKNEMIKTIKQEKEMLEDKYKSVLETEKTNSKGLKRVVAHEAQNNTKEKVDNVELDKCLNPICDQIIRLRELLENESSKDYMQLIWKRSQNSNIAMRTKEIKFLVDKVKLLVEERDSLKQQTNKRNAELDRIPHISQRYNTDSEKRKESRNNGMDHCDNVCKKEIEKWKTHVTKLQAQHNENKTKLENFSFENANLSEKLRQMEIKNRQLQQHNKENKPNRPSKTLERDGRVSPGMQNCTSPDSQNKKGNKWKELRSRDHDSRRSIDLNTIFSEKTESCANCGKMEQEFQTLYSEFSLIKKRSESLESSNDGLKKLCRIRSEEISKLQNQLSRVK